MARDWHGQAPVETPHQGFIPVTSPNPDSLPDLPGSRRSSRLVTQQRYVIASRLKTPNETYLTAYTATGLLALPPVLLPGKLQGFSLGALAHPWCVCRIHLFKPAAVEPTPVWIPLLENSSSNLPPGRIGLEPLNGVQAPFPQLE